MKSPLVSMALGGATPKALPRKKQTGEMKLMMKLANVVQVEDGLMALLGQAVMWSKSGFSRRICSWAGGKSGSQSGVEGRSWSHVNCKG